MKRSQLEKLSEWRESRCALAEEAVGTPWGNYRPRCGSFLKFHWIASLDAPMLEVETPPPSFYFDLVQANAVELGRSIYSGKLLLTLGSQTEDGVETQQCHVGAGEVVPRPMLMDIGNGPDLAHVPAMVDMGTGTEPNPTAMVVVWPQEHRRPLSCGSVSVILMKTVLALSLLHGLYVLSTISYRTFMALLGDIQPLRTPPRTPSLLFGANWQFIVNKLADLRALMP